ncbi:MAG: acylneuraminate cytidylyltransferase family protein [Phycisphaeraceae bacterium]|nr:acylneuraminate cytidylyltransferase family protein [Phycisphaeraceae bacterium]HRJ48968.1 acylneuraminate cytidylyltransferase family protein [Phycisphaerales bacterium]
MTPPRAVAIIPARGGSRGVPRKNVRDFLGRPLLAWSISHAREARPVERIIVSTDDDEIADVSRQSGAEVIRRPPQLATDQAPSEPAIIHALESAYPDRALMPELVVFLQATSPIRDPGDVGGAIDLLLRRGADSLVSVTPSHDFLWLDRGDTAVPLNYNPAHRPRRQDMPARYRENGSLYVMRTEGLLRHRCRLFGSIALYVMDEVRSFQIDTPGDFAVCEAIASARRIPAKHPHASMSRLARAEA